MTVAAAKSSKPGKVAKPAKTAKPVVQAKIPKPLKPAAKVSVKASAKTPTRTASKPSKVVKASKSAPKPISKPRPQAAAKAAPKAKPLVKQGGKSVAQASASKPTAKKPELLKSAAKPAKAAPVVRKPTKPVADAKPAKQEKKASAPKASVPAKAVVKTPAAAKETVKAVAEKPVKTVSEAKSKPGKIEYFKGPFFQEVAPGSPAVRKSRAPQVAAVSFKKPKGEESHDELIARIERELLTVRMTSRKVQKPQVCTKCCINPVDPSYMVDRDTGYCAECAIVLGLGHTREARQQNFHPSLMKSEEEETFEE